MCNDSKYHINVMPYGNYHHKTNKTIKFTYGGRWEIEIDYITFRYSSLMESPALFLFKENEKKSILNIYKYEPIIEEILQKACSVEVLDLSEYFDNDYTDFADNSPKNKSI